MLSSGAIKTDSCRRSPGCRGILSTLTIGAEVSRRCTIRIRMFPGGAIQTHIDGCRSRGRRKFATFAINTNCRRSHSNNTKYFPAPQSTQTALVVAASVVECVPAAQLRHTDANVAPTEVEYFPFTQLKQNVSRSIPAVKEYFPATQLRLIAAVEAHSVVENLPIGQFLHVDTKDAPAETETFRWRNGYNP